MHHAAAKKQSKKGRHDLRTLPRQAGRKRRDGLKIKYSIREEKNSRQKSRQLDKIEDRLFTKDMTFRIEVFLSLARGQVSPLKNLQLQLLFLFIFR